MSGFRKTIHKKIRHIHPFCALLLAVAVLASGCAGEGNSNLPADTGAVTDNGTPGDNVTPTGNGTSSDNGSGTGNETPGDSGTPTSPEDGSESGSEPEYAYDGPCRYPISTMPVIVIYTGSKKISETKDYTDGWISFYTPDGSFDAEKLNAGFRLRGNASRTMDKKSYRFRLEEGLNLFGLANGKEKVWALLANHCDQSLLRNYAAFALQRGFDAAPWSPNGMSVELYVNNVYKGVYLLAEQIRVSKDRVNISEEDPDAVDTGYLVQFTSYAEENIFKIGDSSYEVKSELSEDPGIRQQQMDYIRDYIIRCREALEAGDEEEADRLIDLDSLAAAYLTEEISKNMDSQWDSFYMQKDAGGKLVIGPLWDFDLAFGNDVRAETSKSDSFKHLFVADGRGSVNGTEKTIFVLAMRNDWFQQRVKDMWNAEYPRIAELPDMIAEEAEKHIDAFHRNFAKWRIFGQRINQEPYEIMQLDSYEAHAEYLVTWMRSRIDWLDGEFNRQ